jgi:multiple antibiotic resistance protein
MESVFLLVKFFALAFSALLPLINPLGSALVLLGLVGQAPASVFRDLARKIAIRTALFLAVVELVGTALLEFFGISLPVVQVAGGLVLASMAWNLLNQHEAKADPDRTAVAETIFGPLEQKIFYPLTFPVTAGAGLHCRDADPERSCVGEGCAQRRNGTRGSVSGCGGFVPACLCLLRLCPQDYRAG